MEEIDPGKKEEKVVLDVQRGLGTKKLKKDSIRTFNGRMEQGDFFIG